YITAFSVVIQLIEYNIWYLKEELREIIHNVINKVKNFDQQNSEKYLKIVDIPLK
ncbi:6227_t:CDS:1, partial [Funneliformis caledonium]